MQKTQLRTRNVDHNKYTVTSEQQLHLWKNFPSKQQYCVVQCNMFNGFTMGKNCISNAMCSLPPLPTPTILDLQCIFHHWALEYEYTCTIE